jgi:hypothetical protein
MIGFVHGRSVEFMLSSRTGTLPWNRQTTLMQLKNISELKALIIAGVF